MKSIMLGLAFATLCLVLASQSSAVIDRATIEGLWLFDDGSGDVARDSSGNGRDGVLEGGTQWVAGRYGGALELNGVDGEVVITGYKGIGGTAGRTTALWFKSSEQVNHRLVSWGSSGDTNKYHVRIHEGSTLRIETQGGQLYSNTDAVTDGDWHHLAVVLPDGSDMCHQHLLYVDGVLQTDLGGTDVGVNTNVTENDVEIGYDKVIQNADYTDGCVDEVAIFNVALSAADINTIMMQGFGGVILSVSPSDKLATTWASLKNSD